MLLEGSVRAALGNVCSGAATVLSVGTRGSPNSPGRRGHPHRGQRSGAFLRNSPCPHSEAYASRPAEGHRLLPLKNLGSWLVAQ